MPSGAEHAREINLFRHAVVVNTVAFSVAGATFPFLGFVALAIPVGANVWFYLKKYVDPDLDHIAITMAEGRALDKGLIGIQWVKHWLDYVWLCSKFGGHQKHFSHSVMPGTLVRLLWAHWFLVQVVANFYAGVLAVRWVIMALMTPGLQIYLAIALVYFLGAFIGLGYPDMVHVMMDKAVKEDR